MRTAEESSTVLHRLIQEQLRYGNPTDTRTLLAIQQQALRGGGSSGGGGAGSPRSSLESLTQEETQVLQMSTRQEPQGQEHQGDYTHSESPVCSLYTLHSEDLPTYEEAKAHSQYLAAQRGQVGLVMPQQQQGIAIMDGGHSLMDAQDKLGEGTWDLKREHARSLSERMMQLSLERTGSSENLPMSSSHSYPQLSGYFAGPIASHSQELLSLPMSAPDQRGPPPEYPFLVKPPGYMVSHSQEHAGQYYKEPPPPFHSQHQRYGPAPPMLVRQNALPTMTPAGQEYMMVGQAAPCATSGQNAQVDMLLRENERLRQELEGYGEKAARLTKLEQEIQRISEDYEVLMKGSSKRESLEKAMRNKLEQEIKRMHDFNRDLRDRLETANKQLAAMEVADQSQHVYAKLVEQIEDLQQERDTLEREVLRLRGCGEDLRRRGDALEQALGAAQGRGRQLEEELRRKRAYVEKVERLQSALAQLQAACEKREALELKLRTRLEQELKSLRAQQWQTQGPSAALELSALSLQQQLREREERVLALEADITRWEQKYLEESTMRQFAMDAAATAAAQRDTTIINHSPRHSPNSSFNEDLPSSGHRHQEMENRIRALHAQLLEKDAVIKVLQHRSRCREQQGLRPARSVPSISTIATPTTNTTCTIRSKGKSLSDDQTTGPILSLPPPAARLPPPKAHSQDCSTQCDYPAPTPETVAPPAPTTATASETHAAATHDVSQLPSTTTSAATSLLKCLSGDADMVEILI